MLVTVLDAGADFEEGGGLAGRWSGFHSRPTLCGSLKVSSDQDYHNRPALMKTCRVGHPDDLVIAVRKDSTDGFLTKNVVYREVLLHRRCLPPQLQPASSPPHSGTVVVSADQSDDLDYTGIYDGIADEEEEETDRRGGEEDTVHRTLPAPVTALPSLSHPLPPNVTLAPPPTAREAEVGKYFGSPTYMLFAGCS